MKQIPEKMKQIPPMTSNTKPQLDELSGMILVFFWKSPTAEKANTPGKAKKNMNNLGRNSHFINFISIGTCIQYMKNNAHCKNKVIDIYWHIMGYSIQADFAILLWS